MKVNIYTMIHAAMLRELVERTYRAFATLNTVGK